MQKLRYCIFFCLVLITYTGIGQRNSVVLQLKWWHQFQFAGYYAALTQGYYAKEGLDVKILPGDAGHSSIDEVLSGRASFGITDCDLLTEFAQGKPLVALGAIFQHSPYVIISPENKNIHSPSDLVGKTILASEKQGWIELKGIFLKEGIDINAIHVAPHTWNNNDIINGKADAMTGYISSEPYQMQQAGIPVTYISPANYGIDFYGDLLFTSKDFAEKNPEIVERFRQASFKGWEYALAHKEIMFDYILSLPGVKQRNTTRKALQNEADEMEKLILPQIVEIGHMNEGRWAHILSIQQSLGLIPANTSLEGFMYTKKPGLIESIKAISLWITGTAAAVFLLILIYSIIIRRIVKIKTRALRKTLHELQLSKDALTEKNTELQKLSAYLQHIREDERKRIAREVHDELGQLASAVKIDIDWLNLQLSEMNQPAQKRVTHAASTIVLLINSIRKTASGLRPSVLDDFGLNAALKWHCNEFEQLTGISCTTEIEFDDNFLSPDMKTELFRIVQESLTNVMRHAQAKNTKVVLQEDNYKLHISISDDGKGFDTREQKNTLGLIGLRERVQVLNGTLQINSTTGNGTDVIITIPKNWAQPDEQTL